MYKMNIMARAQCNKNVSNFFYVLLNIVYQKLYISVLKFNFFLCAMEESETQTGLKLLQKALSFILRDLTMITDNIFDSWNQIKSELWLTKIAVIKFFLLKTVI